MLFFHLAEKEYLRYAQGASLMGFFDRMRHFLFVNHTTRQTVVKNAFWLAFGTMGVRVIKAGVVIYAARVLGASGWGVFSYAISIAGFFTIFMDFGINALVNREASRDPHAERKYFATGLGLKIIFFLVIACIVIFLTPLFVKDPAILPLLPIAALMIGLDGIRDYTSSLYRAREEMQKEAGIHIFTNSMITVLGICALLIRQTPYALAWGYALGIGVGTVVSFYPFWHYLRAFAADFRTDLLWPILKTCWPFGMMGLMASVMLNTDTLMIGWFRNTADVGYYGAVQRIVQLLYVIPSVIATSVFPPLVRARVEAERFGYVLDRTLRTLTLIGLPLTIGGMIVSSGIIRLLFGSAYLPAAPVFALMCLTYLPVFFSSILGNAVFALYREKDLIWYVLVGIFGNFFFNLLLIPPLGIAGAALSTVLNQLLVTAYLVYLLRNAMPFSLFAETRRIWGATLVMGIGTLGLHLLGTPVLLIILVAGILYGGVLYATREPLVGELLSPLRKHFSL